ncbi:MAG: DUF5602 domain-containing protein [Chitinophagaceae bacterium]
MKKMFPNFLDFKRINFLFVLFAAVVVSMSLASCEKEDEKDKGKVYQGLAVNMGNGTANSFIKVDRHNKPLEIGITMTKGALTNLPQNPADFERLTFVLGLHEKALELTPFDHIVINWGPQGHPPAGVYNVPHFDFHFYTITLAEQLAIPPYTPASAAKFDLLPPAGFMPASYIPDPGGVPAMGKHWGDPNSLRPFSHTMVYGSYNGQLNFVEPMVTLPVLQSGVTIRTPYAQPEKFAKTGKWYPTKYNIYLDKHTQENFVTLTDFVKR